MRIEERIKPRTRFIQPDVIVFSTEARGLAAHAKAVAAEKERIDADRAAVMAPALSQPHRRGSDDPRLATPLGRFCQAQSLRNECYRAGEKHNEVLRQAKTARGFFVRDMVPGGNRDLDEDQIEALRQAAIIKEQDAVAVLVAIICRAPRVVERLVFDELDPAPNDEDLIKHCLLKLAIHYGYLELGVNRDKAI